LANVAALGLEIENGIRHELTGPVVRDVTAAVRLEHLESALREARITLDEMEP